MQPCYSSSAHAKLGMRSCALLLHILLLTFMFSCQARLSYDFYDATCPNLFSTVQATILAGLLRDPTTPAALVRIFFHDCQVQGCDASILLDSQGGGIVSELGAPANLGIRRLEVIDAVKSAVEKVCPNTVSCADLVVLAAREAVRISGGPSIEVLLGRQDGVTASQARAEAELPSAETGFPGFLQVFLSKGMTLEESVAILGSHTVGVGHCASFASRLYPQKDRSLGPLLYSVLTLRCPPGAAGRSGGGPVFPNDLTPLTFDTQYFSNAIAGRGLFRVDSEVAGNAQTASIMRSFAANPSTFYKAYASAFYKLSLNGVLTQGGTIRSNCRFVN